MQMPTIHHSTDHAARHGYTPEQQKCLSMAAKLGVEVREHDTGSYCFTAPLPKARWIKGPLGRIQGVAHGPFSGDRVTVQF